MYDHEGQLADHLDELIRDVAARAIPLARVADDFGVIEERIRERCARLEEFLGDDEEDQDG